MTKIVNACIVYDLYAWPRNPTNNFKFHNCLFSATNIVKSSDKKIGYIGAMGQYLIVQVHRILIMILPEML